MDALNTDVFADELAYYDLLHQEKYRDKNQTRLNHINRIATSLCSNDAHHIALYDSLHSHRFLPAGRVQAATGASEREVSPFNCAVSQVIEDDMGSIMAALSNAAKILRLGTGIGYNFSHLRPQGALIKKLQTQASGPLSFMKIFDVMASTIASSGHRRGAQMGIMNVSHPDIEVFINAKLYPDAYRQFNLSVGISDAFLKAVEADAPWPLSFEQKVVREVPSRYLWDRIICNAYNSAEPGLIFIDRLNDNNNLFYCESIEATNPCAEQPLPPFGLCTLGSFNLLGYVRHDSFGLGASGFNFLRFEHDIRAWVEAYDNLFDRAIYAIPEHETEAKQKRRIGLGLTGIANAIEYLCGNANYGEPAFVQLFERIARTLRDTAYAASVDLARERGSFALFSDKFLDSAFISNLPSSLQKRIREHGTRNSHLISYAPCGTISQCAGNVSSGVEPVFHHKVVRDVYMAQNRKITIALHDANFRNYGFRGKTLEECSVENHMAVAEVAQRLCDSAVSKTVNVASNCSYEEYADIYVQAHKRGLKGITVYRPTPIRGIVIQNAENVDSLKCTADGNCS